MASFASAAGPPITAETLDAVLLEIDTRTAAIQTSSSSAYHSLRGLIEHYEGLIHARLDSHPIEESADKRRIYVKMEALTKRHTVISVGEAMLTDVISRGLDHLEAESGATSPRFSGGSVRPVGATALQLPPMPQPSSSSPPSSPQQPVSALSATAILEEFIDRVLISVDESLESAKNFVSNAFDDLLKHIIWQQHMLSDRIDRQAMPEDAEKRKVFVKMGCIEKKIWRIKMGKDFFATCLGPAHNF